MVLAFYDERVISQKTRNKMRFQTKIILLAAGIVAGCGSSGTGGGNENGQAVKEITLEPGTIVADPSGGSYEVTVTAPFRPTLGNVPLWISAEFTSVNSAQHRMALTLTVQPNGVTDRKAEIALSAGTAKNMLTVAQKGNPAPGIDKSAISKVPTNPNAGEPARKLYSFLLDNYGVKTLSGAHSGHSQTNDFVNLVGQVTGKHPVVASYDFIFLQFSPTPANWGWKRDYTDITEQKEHWNAGGIPCYMWHWNAPRDEETFRNNITGDGRYGFYCPGSNSGSSETEFDIREALKEGTWQHEFIKADLDEITITFKKLQDEGIPVLFRPLHEAAGNYTRYNPAGGAWFWWGRYGASYCKQLWAFMRDYLENHNGLNNIIWVWTVDVKEGYLDAAKEWYPGDDLVDILGCDTYQDNTGLRSDNFQFMQGVCGGRKILTISECGNIPSPEKNILAGCPWSWFDAWPKTIDDEVVITGHGTLNTEDYWKSIMSSEYVITREDMPSLK